MRLNGKFTKSILVLCTGSVLAIAQTTSTGAAAGQQSGSSKSQSEPVSPHGSHKADHGMSSGQGAGVMVGDQDQKFMMKAAQGGLMEVEAARLAQEKATSSEIKEFARKLEQDHTKANEKLKELAAQKNVQLPTDMGEHAKMLEKIRSASGDQFDKQWMKMQVQHHKKDVNEFSKETNRAMDSDVRSFASNTLPTLQEHLKQAEELQQSTRGRKATSSSDSSAGQASDSTRQHTETATPASPAATK